MPTPLVSVCCITYNHEAYIREAIEGFLAQETDFPIEIIIHDDASTDRTPDIIREYAARYPDVIRPILQVENQYMKGKKLTGLIIPYVRGKYAALCEGDDFWTSPYKLKRQVAFMEAHPECAVCFHSAEVVLTEDDDSVPKQSETIPPFPVRRTRKGVSIADWMQNLYMPTATVMFRCFQGPPPEWYHQLTAAGDWPLLLWVILRGGRLEYLETAEPMAVYRRHRGGISFVSILLNTPQRKQRLMRAMADAYLIEKVLPLLQKRYVRPRLYDLHFTLAHEYAWSNEIATARKHWFRAAYYLVPYGDLKTWHRLLRFGVQTFLPHINNRLMTVMRWTRRLISKFAR